VICFKYVEMRRERVDKINKKGGRKMFRKEDQVICFACGLEIDKDEAYKWDMKESIYADYNALCPDCAEKFYEPCDKCYNGKIQRNFRFPRIRFIPRIGWFPRLNGEKREEFYISLKLSFQIRETIECPYCGGTGNLRWKKRDKIR